MIPAIAERSRLTTPVGIWLVDSLTGGPPGGEVRVFLDINIAGNWEKTWKIPVITPSGVITYPGLGKVAKVGGAAPSPLKYRVRIEADRYVPLYPEIADGVEFEAPSYDDDSPPPRPSKQIVFLLPNSSYPFPGGMQILRGSVLHGGKAVAGAEVNYAAISRTRSDGRGEFALPLTGAPVDEGLTIDASFRVSAATEWTGSIIVQLPKDLMVGKTITIA